MTVLYVLAGIVLALILLFVVLPFVMMSRMRKREGKAAPELEGAAGERVSKGASALFYFYSPQCGACRSMTPVVQKLAQKSKGVFPVDISKDMGTARKFGVMATPTTILIKKGIVERILIGPQPPQTLQKLVKG